MIDGASRFKIISDVQLEDAEVASTDLLLHFVIAPNRTVIVGCCFHIDLRTDVTAECRWESVVVTTDVVEDHLHQVILIRLSGQRSDRYLADQRQRHQEDRDLLG
ncbi:hypothetical protein D3C86_1782400 [compost metagenome]